MIFKEGWGEMKKLNYINKIMDLVGETKSKKHGYYKEISKYFELEA